MSKKTIIAASLLLATPALADMSAAEFFARDRANQWTGPLVNETRSPFGSLPRTYVPANREYVSRIVERETRARLGSQWTSTALRLTKLESGFRCNAQGPRVRSHGGDRAQGALQVMPRTAKAMGLDPRRLTECEYGIRAGIMHMERCIAAGVRTHAQMSACHVAGWGGWNKRLATRPERYKQQYIRMAMR
jgi:hypothetical protein